MSTRDDDIRYGILRYAYPGSPVIFHGWYPLLKAIRLYKHWRTIHPTQIIVLVKGMEGTYP